MLGTLFPLLVVAVVVVPATRLEAAPATRPAPPVKPAADNTGPTGDLRVIPGNVEVVDDHAVLRDVDVRGAIFVRASHVRLLNFKARRVKFFHEKDDGGHRDLLVEDGEITDPAGGTGITGGSMTVRRCELHHLGADAFNVQHDTLLEGNYVHHLGMTDGSHADGVAGTSRDGKPVLGVVIRGNHFDMPSHAVRGAPGARPEAVGFNANAVIFLGLFGSRDRPTIVEDNWLNGGNYTVTSGLPGSHIVYRRNRFGRDYNRGVRRTHDKAQRFTRANWIGNVWDDTGRPAPGVERPATTQPDVASAGQRR